MTIDKPQICICTMPIRPIPTRFPPFGSMAIIQALRSAGENVRFYDIDFHRFSNEQVAEYFRENRFDIVGISAVVSTAYAYTKFLVKTIRSVSPGTRIIVGGNLAASAEILLRKADVDFCVIGDGEIIIQDLVNALRYGHLDDNALASIKGICYLDSKDQFKFTGYGVRPSAEELSWPDYTILEEDGSIDYFIYKELNILLEGNDHHARQEGRAAMVVMAKGCVARCTFCHRFEKGYRMRPVDQIIGHIRHLKEKYDARFISVADENFGADREVAWELATRLGELDVAWYAAGVRTRTVTREALAHWKANGCISVIYGIESGSQTMLNVMEKNATVEENLNALKWTSELGLNTIVQLVIGMPGETDKTVYETIGFLKQVAPLLLMWKNRAPSEMISINYAQALPGTPLYEYAREHRHIGKTVDEEEKYLIRISDTDAYAEDHFLNYTGYPLLKVLLWRPLILTEVDAALLLHYNPLASLTIWQVFKYYFRLFGVRIARRLGHTPSTVDETPDPDGRLRYLDYAADSGYFNIYSNLKYSPLLLNPFTKRLFYPTMALITAFRKSKSPLEAIALVYEHMCWSLRGRKLPTDLPRQSLRKVVKLVSRRNEDAEDRMLPLRSGR